MTSYRTRPAFVLATAILVLAVAAAVPACGNSSTATRSDGGSRSQGEPAGDFQEFWSRFRGAAEAGDRTSIETMTRFPFQTRGQLDNSGGTSHNREEFSEIWARLLQQDSGASAEEEPMQAFILRTTSVGSTQSEEGEVFLGAFVFERVDGRWWFTRAYVDWE